jgi:hypothetical protein
MTALHGKRGQLAKHNHMTLKAAAIAWS